MREEAMSSYSQDEKWVEAKRAVGGLNWLEVISYYRSVDGENVFVYSVIEGDKRLIVDILDDENVLLLNKYGEPIVDSYENVLNSRKVFKYNDENLECVDYVYGSHKYKIRIESHN
jgi:hypothetical protein